MITTLGSRRKCCDGVTRRESLQAGAISMLGGMFGLPRNQNAVANTRATHPAKARSVIVLYLLGGAPTQDMFDMKPDAPGGVGGEFRPISTDVPGMHVCELLPKHAEWMNQSARTDS